MEILTCKKIIDIKRQYVRSFWWASVRKGMCVFLSMIRIMVRGKLGRRWRREVMEIGKRIFRKRFRIELMGVF